VKLRRWSGYGRSRRVSRFCSLFSIVLGGAAFLAASERGAFAQSPCERFDPGSTVSEPEDLYSTDGVLSVDFTYQTYQDGTGKTYFCFINSDGAESPTLHVRPGDVLKLKLTNLIPEQPGKVHGMPEMEMARAGEGGCGAASMTASSVNIHYHGTNTPPTCHQDEVIHTLINSGETFQYEVHFPKDEPPGLYWYHPHIHGLTTAAVTGGASGALVVEGIENVNHRVAGLAQRVLVVREEPTLTPPDDESATNLSVNYVQILGPDFLPAKIEMKPEEKQFWRVVNSAAHSILDLQLQYDNILQPIELIALDSVPLGSQDGSGRGKSQRLTHILIPPAGRAEFIVKGPSSDVADARLITEAVTTGPDGDLDPTRTLLSIQTSSAGARSSDITHVPTASGPRPAERFAGLANVTPNRTRKLYFSEDETYFYITVNGQTPKPFSMDDPPSIVTTQGSVEDWTIENRAQENHEFHMHQIHFLALARNGKALPPDEQQFLDTINVPYWRGQGPYPSVTLRMDFRGPDVGDFVYHCHILDHEDGGMMAIIRVLPKTSVSDLKSVKSTAAKKSTQR